MKEIILNEDLRYVEGYYRHKRVAHLFYFIDYQVPAFSKEQKELAKRLVLIDVIVGIKNKRGEFKFIIDDLAFALLKEKAKQEIESLLNRF